MTNEQAIRYEARRIGVEEAALAAFIEVESGGRGFSGVTGKLIIQFEPHWFRRKAPGAPKGIWSRNRVENQTAEWRAFNDAYAINATAAMESTSIGLGQVMGFHYERLGYRTVGEMWDDAKRGEDRQIFQMAEFINTSGRLKRALKNKDWHMVAVLYNGAGYQNIAAQYGGKPYNVRMEQAYHRHKKKYEQK